MGPCGQQLTQRLKLLVFIFLLCLCLSLGHDDPHHHHHHHHCSHHHDNHEYEIVQSKLPEELAEEEDLRLYGFESHHGHHHGHEHVSWLHHAGNSELSKLGN